VYSANENKGISIVNTENFKAGVYIISIDAEDKKFYEKIVVVK